MKIQLIQPPSDPKFGTGSRTDQNSVPIGLALLAESVKGHEIEVIDSMFEDIDSIILDGDIVGVNAWYSNYNNSLRILKKAKSKGAKTIIGGPNVTYLGKQILSKREYIDYGVIGDGEDAFASIIDDHNPSEISNLVWRRDGEVVENKISNVSLDKIFDVDHLDLSLYDPKKLVPLSSIRGCVKATQTKRCSYCSLSSKLRTMDPSDVWDQIREFHERGFKYFFETGDSFLVGDYPEHLLAKRPTDLKDISFRIYANPEQISSSVIHTLKSLNVKEVFIGLETTDESILRNAKKYHTVEQMDEALQILYSHNINFMGSFVFGLPGETPETLARTYDYIESLYSKYSKGRFLANPAVPLVGTKLFEDLANHSLIKEEYSGDLKEDDIFDYQKLCELQSKYFTSVDTAQINLYVEKVASFDNGLVGFSFIM